MQANNQTVPLVYRSGVCAHLHFTSGHCPRAAREVAVSTSAASLMHWHTGQRIPVPTWGHLVITGQYQVTVASAGARYWFEAASRYFPYETSYGPNASGHPYDAMFTPLATMEVVPGTLQGTDYADYSLIPAHLTGPDVARVQAAVTGLILDPTLTQAGVTTTTSLPATLGTSPGQLAGDRGARGPDHRAAAAAGLAAAVPDRRGRGRGPRSRSGAGQDARPRPVAQPHVQPGRAGDLARRGVAGGRAGRLGDHGRARAHPAAPGHAGRAARLVLAGRRDSDRRRAGRGGGHRAADPEPVGGQPVAAGRAPGGPAGLGAGRHSHHRRRGRTHRAAGQWPDRLGPARCARPAAARAARRRGRGGRLPAADRGLPGRIRGHRPPRPDRAVPRLAARRPQARRDAHHDRAGHRVRPGRIRRRDLDGDRGQHQGRGGRAGRCGHGALGHPARPS